VPRVFAMLHTLEPPTTENMVGVISLLKPLEKQPFLEEERDELK
jgi:hypothetical protein